MAILNKDGYHKVGFAYKGPEAIARIVVQTWPTKNKIGEPKLNTLEIQNKEIKYNLTGEYAMYNYDKSKELCTDEFAVAVYDYLKTVDEYKGADV